MQRRAGATHDASDGGLRRAADPGSDTQIDSLNQSIFGKLFDAAARRRFIAGHNAWLAYRHAYCLSESDVFEGGTEAGVVFADCVAGVNSRHVTDLKRFLASFG